MDKPYNGSITVKLNGETKAFEEVPVEKESVPEVLPAPPAVIRQPDPEQKGLMEIAAAQEAVDDFEWILPGTSGFTEEEPELSFEKNIFKKGKSKSVHPAAGHRKFGGLFFSSVFSVVLAVVIGTAMGLLMLKLVFNQQNGNSSASGVANASQPVNSSGSGSTAGGQQRAANIPALTAYVVQGGVFSTMNSATSAVEDLTSQGIPSVIIQTGGNNCLFIGVADSVDSARQLADFFKKKGVNDVYAKSQTIEGKKISGLSNTEASFLESSVAIYQNLSKVTAGAMAGDSFPNDTLTSAEKQINKNTKVQLKNKKADAMKKDLAAALAKLKAYQSGSQSKDLTDAQQSLLNYLSDFNSL